MRRRRRRRQIAATTGQATEGEATRGGRLRVGHVGAGKGESFNPARGSSFIDASRYYNVFDPLSRVGPTLEVEPGLALEWSPNDDSTVWVVALRPDVTWHDGKPFTADDVMYTFGEMADPKHVSHASVTNINLRDVRKIDDLTLEIPLKSPNARPLRLLRPAEHGDRPERGDGLHEPRGHGRVHVRLVHGRGEQPLRAGTRTTGTRASLTSTSGRTSRSTTTRPAERPPLR